MCEDLDQYESWMSKKCELNQCSRDQIMNTGIAKMWLEMCVGVNQGNSFEATLRILEFIPKVL